MNTKSINSEEAVAILFKQGKIIAAMRSASKVDKDCPTELIPEVIESIIRTNKRLRAENTRLQKQLKLERRRD